MPSESTTFVPDTWRRPLLEVVAVPVAEAVTAEPVAVVEAVPQVDSVALAPALSVAISLDPYVVLDLCLCFLDVELEFHVPPAYSSPPIPSVEFAPGVVVTEAVGAAVTEIVAAAVTEILAAAVPAVPVTVAPVAVVTSAELDSEIR